MLLIQKALSSRHMFRSPHQLWPQEAVPAADKQETGCPCWQDTQLSAEPAAPASALCARPLAEVLTLEQVPLACLLLPPPPPPGRESAEGSVSSGLTASIYNSSLSTLKSPDSFQKTTNSLANATVPGNLFLSTLFRASGSLAFFLEIIHLWI